MVKASVAHIIIEDAFRDLAEDALTLLKSDSASVPTASAAPVFEDLYLLSSVAQEVNVAVEKPVWESNGIIIHSSGMCHVYNNCSIRLTNYKGSTAFPKPIMWTHERVMQLSTIPWYGERDLCGKRMACHSMPMYHAMGYLLSIWAVRLL